MSKRILIRCDYFKGSGAGHLKRCHILALSLKQKGYEPILLLDESSLETLVPLSVTHEYLNLKKYKDHKDVHLITDAAYRYNTNLLIVDSYRISTKWVNELFRAHIKVILIDDLGVDYGAEISINYTPLNPIKTIQDNILKFRGVRYFITDSQSFEIKNREVQRIIAHAGGTGDYQKAPFAYLALSHLSKELSIPVDWVCPNLCSRDHLSKIIKLKSGDKVLDWEKNSTDLWSKYDIVFGPSSTSLYESIIQGTLPISFPISDTQSTLREDWLSIGHLLHITSSDIDNYDEIKSLIRLAILNNIDFLNIILDKSRTLDGQGVIRVVKIIDQYFSGSKVQELKISDNLIAKGISKCTIFHAESFLKARNSSKVREMSTNPNRIINWSEHLSWWLKGTAEKYVFTNSNGPEAFFWVKKWLIDGTGYLTAGWFPANEQTPFTTILRILNWQIDHYSKKFPDYTWVATVKASNRAAMALNRRFGFVDAEPKTLEIVSKLFPGTNSKFKVFERKLIR